METNNKIKLEMGKTYVCALGGHSEIGKNMTIVCRDGNYIIMDCGANPSVKGFGIETEMADISYLVNKNIQGLVITHAHLDHIMAIKYVYEVLGRSIPIYTRPFTANLIRRQESKIEDLIFDIRESEVNKWIRISEDFTVKFINVTHSIPDSTMVEVMTPSGSDKKERLLFSGDFKFDDDPVYNMFTKDRDGDTEDPKSNYQYLESLKGQIDCLFCDSTSANVQGHSIEERIVFNNMQKLFATCKRPIIITLFSSNVNRIKGIVYNAAKSGRVVFPMGNSVVNNVESAIATGFLKRSDIKSITDITKYARENIVIICTGCQAEIGAALSRMVQAFGTEKARITYKKGGSIDVTSLPPLDGCVVVFSSSKIPQNVMAIETLKGELIRKGGLIIDGQTHCWQRSQILMSPAKAMMSQHTKNNCNDCKSSGFACGLLHTGGHGNMEDIRRLLKMVKPMFVVPSYCDTFHGYFTNMVAQEEKIPSLMITNGDIIEIRHHETSIDRHSTVKKIGSISQTAVCKVGNNIIHIDDQMLAHRKQMASEGVVTVGITLSGKHRNNIDVFIKMFGILPSYDIRAKQNKNIEEQCKNIKMKIIRQVRETWNEYNGHNIREIDNIIKNNIIKIFSTDRSISTPLVIILPMKLFESQDN